MRSMWTNSTTWCSACWLRHPFGEVPDRCSIHMAVDIRYGVTTPPVTVLDAQGLLQATRQHWGMETGCKDAEMQFPEDAMRTRTGQAPHVMATLNNLALSLLGRLGITNVAEAQRALNYHIDRALHGLALRTPGQGTM